jgi:hypothetical protein
MDVLFLLVAQQDYDGAMRALDVTAKAVSNRRSNGRKRPRTPK